MARRLHTPTREKLTTRDLEALRQDLALMPLHELEIYYKASHGSCRLGLRPPSAKLIQEFVQVWKELSKRQPVGR